EAVSSVLGINAGLALLGRRLTQTYVLVPLGWLVLLPLFLVKFAPFLCKRYTLTNRRLMIQRGLKAKSKQEVALSAIDDVRLVGDSYNPFYRAATLEVLSGGKVVLTLTGVPEPESFRQSILNAVYAWVPGKSRALPMIPASATADK
ncbi:MAG TPA: PH domain-containing protein, partial [Gemmataceae bacterium]|nr:PH domain-containing protein [Gemmataceae bacterium]